MIKEAILRELNKGDLSFQEAYAVMGEILEEKTSPIQNAAFLSALSAKNTGAATVEEICGCAEAMRDHALPLELGPDLFDIVGTGGDNAQSFNISTTAALVAAAGGMRVAKHGRGATSSKSGTADCLEALGVNIRQSPRRCAELLEKVGICFLFGGMYHHALEPLSPVRRELGSRTVFNILGPLSNPARPAVQLLGVYNQALVQPLALALMRLGVRRGMVVCGQDGIDEISMSAPTVVCEFREGWIKPGVISPDDFGFHRCARDDLVGGTPQENAAITRAVLDGEWGFKRSTVLMNAGAALYLGDRADSIASGVLLAARLIDSGAAKETLEKFVALSNLPEEE